MGDVERGEGGGIVSEAWKRKGGCGWEQRWLMVGRLLMQLGAMARRFVAFLEPRGRRYGLHRPGRGCGRRAQGRAERRGGAGAGAAARESSGHSYSSPCHVDSCSIFTLRHGPVKAASHRSLSDLPLHGLVAASLRHPQSCQAVICLPRCCCGSDNRLYARPRQTATSLPLPSLLGIALVESRYSNCI